MRRTFTLLPLVLLAVLSVGCGSASAPDEPDVPGDGLVDDTPVFVLPEMAGWTVEEALAELDDLPRDG